MERIIEWQDFNKLVEEMFVKDLNNMNIAYRGQSDANWKLEPSILRLINVDEISKQKASYYEVQTVYEFTSKFEYNQGRNSVRDADPISLYFEMQHYSCPTRLLDWSSSPYIALYFAVNDSFETDGAIYSFSPNIYHKYMSNLYEDFASINHLNVLKHSKYEVLQLVFSTNQNERVARQKGIFTISNSILKSHCDIIPDSVKCLQKYIIPKERKIEFLARLRYMNITAESLFPGLDGAGRAIRESLLIRQWSKE